MNCKGIRDLIITDYIDQEASKAVQEEVRAHLMLCAQCRDFEQAVREKASEPLKGLEPATPPESIWQGIQEAIEEEEAVTPSLLQRIAAFLAGAFAVRKPAVAFSAAFAVILVSVAILLPLYRQWAVKGYVREQVDYMRSTASPVNGELEKDIGFGTAIEEVFLGDFLKVPVV